MIKQKQGEIMIKIERILPKKISKDKYEFCFNNIKAEFEIDKRIGKPKQVSNFIDINLFKRDKENENWGRISWKNCDTYKFSLEEIIFFHQLNEEIIKLVVGVYPNLDCNINIQPPYWSYGEQAEKQGGENVTTSNS
jgi:hypothetical protein